MRDFEVIGYMKAIPGEDDFSMFINENTYGSNGGYEWKFLDFCPDHPHEYQRIFVHTMSMDEIRRKIRHEEDIKGIMGSEMVTDMSEFKKDLTEILGLAEWAPKHLWGRINAICEKYGIDPKDLT